MNRVVCCVLMSVCLLAGCSKKEPPSAIVQKLEAAGAGGMSGASVNSIQQWLQQHEEVALQLKKDCEQIRKSGTTSADWGDSTEGRVCTAAANTSFYHPYKGDNKTF
jgi:outer membrane murein-binding lipoprotein Lpp